MPTRVVEDAEHGLHHADRDPLQQRQAEHRPEQRQRRPPGGPGRRRREALAEHGLQADPGQDRGQPDQELLQQQQARAGPSARSGRSGPIGPWCCRAAPTDPIPASTYAAVPPATTSGRPSISRMLRRTIRNAPSRISPMVSGRSGISAVRAASSTGGRAGPGQRRHRASADTRSGQAGDSPERPPCGTWRMSSAGRGGRLGHVRTGRCAPKRCDRCVGPHARVTHRIASATSAEGGEGNHVTETAKAGGVRSRVLVVDDDAALAEMLSHRPAQRGLRPDLVRPRGQGAGGVPRRPARPGAARPDAARARRGGRVPRHPRRVRWCRS